MSKKTYLLLSLILLSCLMTWTDGEGATQQYTLTVVKAGSGSGTVTSSPAGISCGSDCSEPYKKGRNVTLKAKADSSSTFKGWSGGCTGMSPSCKLTMNSDQVVTATFALPDLRQVSAWTFGDETSLDEATARGAIDEVNVDWFLSREDGSLDKSEENLPFVEEAHSRGLKVLATVSNYSTDIGDFDSHLADRILRSTKLQKRHVSEIVQLCVEKGYDGIDLDWESVYAADRNRFTKFVQQLAAKLHERGKLLSIAVHAKTSEPGDWYGAQAEDWEKIGAAVDEFKVMTYDYSGSWSEPGPVAPPDWMDEVMTFAETLVPAAKIRMGVPFYGYDWSGSGAVGVSWTDVQSLISMYQPSIVRDPSGEATFQYETDVPHVVFFQDRPAIAAKLEMLRNKHPSVSGIAIWVMGGEDPGFWDEIAQHLRSYQPSSRDSSVDSARGDPVH